MSSDLSTIPFDHYQRYAGAAALVESLGEGVDTVLEVGANRQRLLAQFLPAARFVYSDLTPMPDAGDDFVMADATALPFSRGQFDVIVCLDVMEHIPAHLRVAAIGEMARVSGRMVVVACPVDKPWVHDAEARANGFWQHSFGTGYPWLDEHKEFGLVDGDQVEQAFRAAGMQLSRFGHADVNVWSGLMGAHFIKERIPELQPLVAAADTLYNTVVFSGDRGEACYREFFVATWTDEDLGRVRQAPKPDTPSGPQVAAFLRGLPDMLQPAVDRTLAAETAWSQTATYVRELEAQLAAERSRMQEAMDHHRAAEVHAHEAEQLAHVADERAHEARERACVAEASAETATRRAGELERSLQMASEQWGVTAELVRQLEARNGELQQRLDATAVELRDSRLEYEKLGRRLSQLENRQQAALWCLALGTVVLAAFATYFFWT